MPSSHGGGSSGGGFSGGGGHFSGGSGGNHGPRFSTRSAFPGSRRYYYTNSLGRTYFFYYAGSPTRESFTSSVIFPALFVLAGLVLFAVMVYSLLPHKMNERYLKSVGVYIQDEANVLTDQKEVTESLRTFYDKTGIEPYVYTFLAKDFNTQRYGSLNASNLEDFAYKLYVNTFDDEGHWMIVIAVGDTTEDWIWCDMAGDDTTFITDDLWSSFRSDLQKNLSKDDVSISKAVSLTFDNATYNATHLSRSSRLGLIFVIVFAVIWEIGSISVLVNSIKRVKMINEYCDFRDKRGGRDFYDAPKKEERVSYQEFTANDDPNKYGGGQNTDKNDDLFD